MRNPDFKTSTKQMSHGAYMGLCIVSWVVGAFVASGFSPLLATFYAEATVPVIFGFWVGKALAGNKGSDWKGIIVFPVICLVAGLFSHAIGDTLAQQNPGSPNMSAGIALAVASCLSYVFFVFIIRERSAEKLNALKEQVPAKTIDQDRGATRQQTTNVVSVTAPTIHSYASAITMAPSPSSANLPESSNVPPLPTVVDEDRIYAVIASELEEGVANKGLWMRLFAECCGDEKQTKVLYIKQRADRLISAERWRLQQVQVAREHAVEADRMEKLRLVRLSLREKFMEGGTVTEELLNTLRSMSGTYSAVTLLNSVRLNKLNEVRAILEEKPLLVAVFNSDGDTPLHIAVREKYEAMVRLLIESGAPVEMKNRYDVSPLEYAKNSKQAEMAGLLAAASSPDIT
ncbi:hypothetical protein AGMMS50225_04410 [Betaproteobacteria bacterium]|nr:hypothetical protein AGMMS50225_04410 [Betaproteobacteria bacterium]